MRAVWKGAIRFSLVTIPVEAYTAAEPEQADIHLNQLHDQCHSRIRYKKTCPIHGEVSNDEIVTGYEYEKDHYVVVDRKEVEKAVGGDHSIAVEAFITPDEIDPMYYDGRTYFLAPAKAGEKPYAVFREAMEKMGRYGVATVTMVGKQHPVILRAVENIITMTMLLGSSMNIRSTSFVPLRGHRHFSRSLLR
jgi:DNA end-binding protein Ku